MRTYNPTPADITRQWHVIDANDVVLGRQMLSKLKIYAGPTHPHQAQSPVPYELTQVAQ